MKILIRWLITAIAIIVTVWLMPGIRIEGTNAFIAVSVMALVLGLVNAIIRPILAFFSCGCIVATLGLFMLVINAFTLLIAVLDLYQSAWGWFLCRWFSGSILRFDRDQYYFFYLIDAPDRRSKIS